MKIAIIGAGVAGLACAHELEKHGINPVIYERNSFIGGNISHVSSFLEITHRPIKDALKYIYEKFDIDIKPLNTINTLVHYSPNKTAEMKGNLGYFVLRGNHSNDLCNQIYSKLKNTGVLFNQNVNFDTLAGQYDYIIVANGDTSMTSELGCWQKWFKGYERGGTVSGSFDPHTLTMWINKDYCKSGYAYFAPYDSSKGFITLVVSDVNEKEIEHYWEAFLYAENIKYTFTEEFKVEHIGGYAYPHKKDNIFFIGNAGGAVDPFLGFGQFNSIVMGVMAARSIIHGKDYEDLIKRIVKRNVQMYQFRKSFNALTNKGYDNLIASIGLPGIRSLLYTSPINIVKHGSYILKNSNAKK